jgi:hypothetical protein
MKIISTAPASFFFTKTIVDDDGESVEKKFKVKLGTRITLDGGVSCLYNEKRRTFSVSYPPAKQTYRTGLPVYDRAGNMLYDKATKFTGITEGELIKQFSPEFVKTIKECI